MYYPSYDAPASFISIPIVKEGKKIGVLIFQIPVDRINHITTMGGKWAKSGLGKTGQTYLIGSDLKMRSLTRKLIEQPDQYIKNLESKNIDQKSFNYIKSKKTNALATSVSTDGAKEAVSGKDSFSVFEGMDHEPVFSAYRPLDIEGLNWYILSEIDQHEALNAVEELRLMMIIALIVTIIVILFLSYAIANSLFKSLMNIANNVKAEAKKVSESSEHLDKDSNELSSATSEQVSSLTQTSASINEISAMVDRNSQSAENVSSLSAQSKDKASQGQQTIQDVRQAIDEIFENNTKLSSFVEHNNDELTEIISVIQSIGDKTQVINDIVFQTRLLSFNASVEAARAGEHGKGFAVVAEEIGGLANMSGSAATEITELLTDSSEKVKKIIHSSQTQMNDILETGKNKVDQGLQTTDRSREILEEIVETFTSVNKGIADITSSAIEQSQGVQEINKAISLLDSTTHKNSQIAKNSSHNATELKDTANELEQSIDELQVLLNGYASHK